MEHQKRVLQWADNADSVEKLEFLKAFVSTMGAIERSKLKNILGHQKRGSKREWKGSSYEEFVNAKKPKPEAKGTVELRPAAASVELQPTACAVELRPTVPVAELKPAVIPWWKAFSSENCVAIDVEKVLMKDLRGIGRQKPGIVAIVDYNGKDIYNERIYREPGSFLTNYMNVKLSAIDRNTLKNGKPWNLVKQELKNVLKDKLVVTVDGFNDLYCLEMDDSDYAKHFDLQCILF